MFPPSPYSLNTRRCLVHPLPPLPKRTHIVTEPQVVGMESRPCQTWSAQKRIVVDHLKRLQRDALLCRSLFVVQIESNLAFESDHHAAFLQEEPELYNLVFMRECEARVGTRTTQKTKDQMTLLMMEVVSMDSLVFYENMVSTEDDAVSMKALLFQQLENFSAVGTARGNHIYTGKVNKMQDDLAMTLMMNMLYFRQFMSDHTLYGRYHTHAP
jgi:hypothetical protein